MIKTGLIGYGYWGKIIESKLDSLSDKIFIQTSKNYDPSKFSEVDWIFIATPFKTHYDIAKDCIQKQKNVFIEKPFCATVSQGEELISLAKQNNVSLCIDNVFLLRNELAYIKDQTISSIKFYWHKNGPFNDNLVNDLLYHDLYILTESVGYKKVSNINVSVNEKDILAFSVLYGDIKVDIDYNRISPGEKTKIIYIDGLPIDFSTTNEDPLKLFIDNCINSKMDFEANHTLNLHVTALMKDISNYLLKNS